MESQNAKQAPEWERIGSGEYRHATGARVYRYNWRKAFQSQEWGVQMPTERSGSGGFASMREAKQFVERHAGGVK